jgi:hypothetical protein
MSNLNKFRSNLITAAQDITNADRLSNIQDSFELYDQHSFERAFPYINEYVIGIDESERRTEPFFDAGNIFNPITANGILIDGWTLGACLDEIDLGRDHNNTDEQQLCLANLITGKVLWDTIYWFHSEYKQARFDKYADDKLVQELLRHCCKLTSQNYSEFESVLPHEVYKERRIYSQYMLKDLAVFIRRVSHYANLGSSFGINYLPHPLRAEYVRRSGIAEKFNRGMIFDKLDSDRKKRYADIDMQLEHKIIRFNYPLLYSFINQNANTPREKLSVAFELYNDKDIIELRSYLAGIEGEVNSGRLSGLERTLRNIDELSAQIANDNFRNKAVGELSVAISPNLNALTADSNDSSKIANLNFISRLLDFERENFD